MTNTPLHQFGDLLRSLLISIPMPMVRLLFLALIAIVLVIVLRLPNSATTPVKSGAVRWDENLKIWGALALVIQLLIYLFI